VLAARTGLAGMLAALEQRLASTRGRRS
jgi:hypothetical protein